MCNKSLDSLPFELIEHILNFDILSYVDLCKLSSVSQLFNCLTKRNKLWFIKYGQMWPSMVTFFDPVSTDWKNEFKQRIIFRRCIHDKLVEMTEEFYHLDNVSNDSFHDFKNICCNHPLTDYILVEELAGIINDSNCDTNLTIKYYAEKALIYVRHTMLDGIWHSFLDYESRPSLLKGACLIQQWCQPGKINCTCDVTHGINEIIQLVFDEVKKVCPSHPVIKKGYSCIENESGESLEKSLWDPYHCKVILKCINKIMYENLRFRPIEHLSSVEFVYIDQVMRDKMGIPVTVGIIYETVAGKLGVHLSPVIFPGRFLLKWHEHPERLTDDSWTYLDVYDSGKFTKTHEMVEFTAGYDNLAQTWVEAVPPVKVFARICWNLVEVGRQHDECGEGLSCLCNSLELLSILCPDDMEHKLLLARVYMHLCINITRVISLLQEIAENDPISTGIVGYMYRAAITTLESQKMNKEIKKLRHQQRDEDCTNVEFAVGMLMVHKKYHYRCVIYGWDPICSASKDWIKRMGVNKLQYKAQQPFYHVLVEDGTNRYAAQENLAIDFRQFPITHMEIGRYFESFHLYYYLPNDQKKLEYPDDDEVREKIYSQTTFPKCSCSLTLV